MSGNLHCLSSHIFFCKVIRNITTQQDGRGKDTRCTYLAVVLWVAVVGYGKANFNKLIDGKPGLSQKMKTKQVFIVLDWKRNTSIEKEEGKIILDLLSVI